MCAKTFPLLFGPFSLAAESKIDSISPEMLDPLCMVGVMGNAVCFVAGLSFGGWVFEVGFDLQHLSIFDIHFTVVNTKDAGCREAFDIGWSFFMSIRVHRGALLLRKNSRLFFRFITDDHAVQFADSVGLLPKEIFQNVRDASQ